MSRILIVDSSFDEETAQITQQMAEFLKGQGFLVDTAFVNQIQALSLELYSGILIGNPAQEGKLNPLLQDWIRSNKTILCERAAGLFMVSPESKFGTAKGERKIVEDFVRSTGWYPTLHSFLAGQRSLRNLSEKNLWQNVSSFIEDFVIELQVRKEGSFDLALASEL